MYPILDTRVECKKVCHHVINAIIVIRIEPDWNVKAAGTRKLYKGARIRIEPDWNVKICP